MESANAQFGAKNARGISTGQATSAYKQLASGQRELYSQFRVKVLDQSATTVSLYKIFTGAGLPLAKLYLSKHGQAGEPQRHQRCRQHQLDDGLEERMAHDSDAHGRGRRVPARSRSGTTARRSIR